MGKGDWKGEKDAAMPSVYVGQENRVALPRRGQPPRMWRVSLKMSGTE